MIGLIFAGITLSAIVMATFVGELRRAILALWIAGLGMGGIYLTLGAEFLAVVQWIISTLVTISFVFFSVMFGEYHPNHAKEEDRNHQSRTQILLPALSVVLGAGFAAIIALGSETLPQAALIENFLPENLISIGKTLTQDHFLSLEVLALLLFLVLIGGGVIARVEEEGD